MNRKMIFALLILALPLAGCAEEKSRYFTDISEVPTFVEPDHIDSTETALPIETGIAATPTFLPASSFLSHAEYMTPPSNFWGCEEEDSGTWLCKIFSMGEVAMDEPVESFYVEYDRSGIVVSFRFVQYIYEGADAGSLDNFVLRSDSVVEYSSESGNTAEEKAEVRKYASEFFAEYLPQADSIPADNSYSCSDFDVKFVLDQDFFAVVLYPHSEDIDHEPDK